jgi:hypothetical protein
VAPRRGPSKSSSPPALLASSSASKYAPAPGPPTRSRCGRWRPPAPIGADGRLVEGGLLIEEAWKGKGIEALLRAEASREIAARNAGRAALFNAGPLNDAAG